MGFIMEFAENLVLRLMEDPRDRCKKTKEMWSLPLRPYGLWTFERHNAQIFGDYANLCWLEFVTFTMLRFSGIMRTYVGLNL
ncbi:NADH dehydrogenase [Handroanthus impetiginosus]|uniref:NADH dehydrogenase n=1 Tax=Handroanthus impetiginosus TaxID=429701 RepID=A0A2G9G1X6_9LAMI|nr:NADH dehydrogenase [Handroanthus impetiginosus]